MKAKEYVDSLFTGYEDTAALADFKEELTSNLQAKVESMARKGLDEAAAFEKAAAELGDISALADEISLSKRREVIEERYLDIRRYLRLGRVLGYILCGFSLILGAVLALIFYLAEREHFGFTSPAAPYLAPPREYLAGVFAVLFPFFVLSAGGFCFLALTQESSARYPLGRKRALWYVLGVILLAAGAVLAPMIYFGAAEEGGLIGALVAFISLALPGAGLLCFLVLTEKNRLKPWAREREIFAGPRAETRFGLFSAAIWIFAAALFFTAGFTAGFKFSWIVLIAAAGMECLLLALMSKKDNRHG